MAKPAVSAVLLLFSLSMFASLVITPVRAFANGQNASTVIGQPNFTSFPQNGMGLPLGIALDSSGNVWIADSSNNRVLRFAPPFSNGMNASLVIGQTDFAENKGATTQNGLTGPIGVTIDSSGNLWVADSDNNRVLRYAPPFTNGMNANLVIGQPHFTTSHGEYITSWSSLYHPYSMVFDSSSNLWITDTMSNRVLKFSPPFTNGMGAAMVMGQSTFDSNSSGVSDRNLDKPVSLAFDDSGNLWVSDTWNDRILRFNKPLSQGMSANLTIGQSSFYSLFPSTTQNGLSGPGFLKTDSSGNLWIADVGNNRILEYSAPFTKGMNASLVIGQPNFVSGVPGNSQTTFNSPIGLAFDSTSDLWVSDARNSRAMRFAAPPATGKAADLVLGQTAFIGTAQNTLRAPSGLIVDSTGNLWAADDGNHRVVRFSPTFTNGMNSSLVIGQSGFTSRTATTSRNGLASADGIALDGSGNLWVADYYSNRILMFSPPFSIGMNASLVIGQSSFTTHASGTTARLLNSPRGIAFDSSGNLWVTDFSNNRVLRFSPPYATGMNASVVLGQTSFTANGSDATQSGMKNPWGLTFDPSGNLWVTDYGNNRALRFAPPFSNGMKANLVIGQSSFTNGAAAATESGLNQPEGILFDPRGNLWIADKSNNRVLRYTAPLANGVAANLVIGQPGFTTTTAATSQGGLYSPKMLAFDSAGNLWVSDSFNTRVLEFVCGSECPPSSLSFSYSVQGGGTGYTAPTLAYISGGAPHTSALSATSASFSIDYGSSWSVTGTLSGSSTSE